VSVPELDRLVALLQEHPSVHGARLTGAGFGGACVALCRAGEAARAGREVVARYGERGRVLVPLTEARA
jgi:galactokinase